MHVMLADDIDGGIFMILILGGVLITSVMALIGLAPAMRGDKAGTLRLIAPGFLCGVAIVVWLAWQFIADRREDPHEKFNRNDILVFIVLAGPALATSLLGALVLWAKRRKMSGTATPKA